MQKSINIFSAILLKLFNLASKSSCAGVWGIAIRLTYTKYNNPFTKVF